MRDRSDVNAYGAMVVKAAIIYRIENIYDLNKLREIVSVVMGGRGYVERDLNGELAITYQATEDPILQVLAEKEERRILRQ